MCERTRRNAVWIVLGIIALFAGCTQHEVDTPTVFEELRAESLATLREVMGTQERWVKVHAAEWLLELGYPQGIAEEFHAELEKYGDEPEYRVGIWRVLAKIPQSARESKAWIDKIKAASIDPKSPDRVHATESLAKLGVSLSSAETASVTNSIKSDDVRLASYSQWLLAVNGDKRKVQIERLCTFLESPDVDSRRIAAYALQFLGPLDDANWTSVVDRANAESDLLTKIRLHGATLMAAPVGADKSELDSSRAAVFEIATQEGRSFDGELIRILAEVGGPEDLHLLENYLGTSSAAVPDAKIDPITADLRAGAANAILRTDRRHRFHHIHWIDWAVIVGYAMAMLGIGWYYSYRTKDRDDYLLGGRSMRPWMVGLSLFATILSTISYLAYPGELIKEGPLVLSAIFALPLVYFAVGWWLIPTLMAIHGASGYELLEKKLGVGVRLLGASVFLLLRLVWMATIIYATVNVALLPALGINPAYTPLLCAILGCVTLGYTSMGGLRAVVLTDVIQTFILFGGAVVTVLLVTYHFGGLHWIPTSWPSHWRAPNYGPGFQERITVGNSIVFMLAWYICTCGSDQMAIQRFKATRDVAAARRSFGVSLVAAFMVKAMLGVVGVAVMAYFLDQPQKLPDRTTVFTNADQMFPSFLVVGIPVGLTGLVVAGMMAASMSSLSSGISAATSVISDDFIKRFRGLPSQERASVTEERCIAVSIGVIVVTLSLSVGYVPGNLFEITNRLVNAFIAPLFVLFFTAMFVPRANAIGAVVGFVISAVVAIAIALFQFMDISMMWIVPASMVIGCGTASIASSVTNRES